MTINKFLYVSILCTLAGCVMNKTSTEGDSDQQCLANKTQPEDQGVGYACYNVLKNTSGEYVFSSCIEKFKCEFDKLSPGCYVLADLQGKYVPGTDAYLKYYYNDPNFPGSYYYMKNAKTEEILNPLQVLLQDDNYVAAGIKDLLDKDKIVDDCYDASELAKGQQQISEDDVENLVPDLTCYPNLRIEDNTSYILPMVCIGETLFVDNSSNSLDKNGSTPNRPLLVGVNIKDYSEKDYDKYYALVVDPSTSTIKFATKIIRGNKQYVKSIPELASEKNPSTTDLKAVVSVNLPTDLGQLTLALVKYKGNQSPQDVVIGQPYNTNFEELATKSETLASSKTIDDAGATTKLVANSRIFNVCYNSNPSNLNLNALSKVNSKNFEDNVTKVFSDDNDANIIDGNIIVNFNRVQIPTTGKGTLPDIMDKDGSILLDENILGSPVLTKNIELAIVNWVLKFNAIKTNSYNTNNFDASGTIKADYEKSAVFDNSAILIHCKSIRSYDFLGGTYGNSITDQVIKNFGTNFTLIKNNVANYSPISPIAIIVKDNRLSELNITDYATGDIGPLIKTAIHELVHCWSPNANKPEDETSSETEQHNAFCDSRGGPYCLFRYYDSKNTKFADRYNADNISTESDFNTKVVQQMNLCENHKQIIINRLFTRAILPTPDLTILYDE